MKIQITDDTGKEVFSYIGGAITVDGLTPAGMKVAVAAALHDATQILTSDHSVIASIKADIQAAVSRIETELGGHPAFTTAQTKLGEAMSHLEAYVKGVWQAAT
jgi:hypothetical protein